MLIYRVARGVRDHFPVRATEWGFAALLLDTGRVLLTGEPNFTSRAFAPLAEYASETVWGLGCVTVGALRLLALLVNGTFAGTAYMRWSPHVRMACAFASCFFWTQITLAYWAGAPEAVSGVAYKWLLIIDAYNVFRCAQDMREIDEAAKRGSP